jgi:cell division protein FtsB
LYDKLFADFVSLQRDYDTLSREKDELHRTATDLKDTLERKESYYITQSEKLIADADSATQLTEKQNRLIVSLEEKVSI